MKKWKNVLVGCAAVAGLASASPLVASTGNFTAPLTNASLSVDLNGGIIASNDSSTEGWNGSHSTPVLNPDPFGVQWSPWGGPTNTSGDGTQLPDDQASPTNAASSITKTFGAITATISEPGTAGNYTTVSGIVSFKSRDRGAPTGSAGDSDLFRDFIFAGGSGSNVQSTNYMQVSLTGLAPSTPYEIALYSYDSAGAHSMNWTATPPTSNLSNSGHLGYNPDPTDVFTAPADEQTITWTAGTAPAPAVFTITSDPTGALNVWGWGGTGVTGNQSADTSYLNGFQIAAVPEPASIGLFGIASLSLLGRRRNKTA